MLLNNGDIGANVILNVVISKREDDVFFPIETFVIKEDVKVDDLEKFRKLLNKFKKDVENVCNENKQKEKSIKKTKTKKSKGSGVRKKKRKTDNS